MPANEDDLVALEVTWTPAAEQDRLSSAEIEVVHPDLLPLDAGAAVGRVRCTYCRAIHAAELGECPACGAKDSQRSGQKPDATGVADIQCAHCGRATPGYEVRCNHCGARAAK